MQNVVGIRTDRLNPLSFGGCILWLSSNRNLNDRGSVRDWSGQNNNGTYNGSGGYPVYNQGFLFDGLNNYLDLGNGLDSVFSQGGQDNPFSFSVWFFNTNVRAPVLTKEIEGGDRNWQSLLYDGTLHFALYTTVGGNRISRIATSPSLNVWHNMIGIYDGSETSAGLKIFIDDVRVDTSDDNLGSYTGMTNTASLKVGIGPGSGPIYFNGFIDEIFLFNRILSNLEIRFLYERDKRRFRGE